MGCTTRGKVPDALGASDGGTAAVGGEDCAGDVAGLRRGEEDDNLGDLTGPRGAGQQGGGAEGFDAVGRRAGSKDRSRSEGNRTAPRSAGRSRPATGRRPP